MCSFLSWNAPFTQFAFLPLLSLFLSLCYNASGTTDYLAYLLQEPKKKCHSWLSDIMCVTEHERASGPCIMKQSVGRGGRSVREAEVVHWPDTAGKKRQHCWTRQRGILSFFPSACSSPNQPQPFNGRGRGVIGRHTMSGLCKICVKNCEYVTTQPYKAGRHGGKVCMCVWIWRKLSL